MHLIGKPIEDFLEEKDIPELRKQFNLKFLSSSNGTSAMETNGRCEDAERMIFSGHLLSLLLSSVMFYEIQFQRS